MLIHVVDGTYELFRHFYGLRRAKEPEDRPFGAVVGVVNTIFDMIEKGATHVGVATDHVIESFRNDLWPELQDGRGDGARARRPIPPTRASAHLCRRRRLANDRTRGG